MAVNWALGQSGGNALSGFMEGMERGRQHRRENALLAQRQEELDYQRQTREQAQQQSQRERLQAAAQALRPVYQRLRQLPYEQRRQELAALAPRLQAQGIDGQIIAGYDPTDANLDNDILLSRRVTGEGYTLSPGDIRFGPDNREVARGGAAPPRVIPVPQGGGVWIDGQGFTPAEQTATNQQTGQRYRFNPQTQQWDEIQGGPQGSNPAGSFPPGRR